MPRICAEGCTVEPPPGVQKPVQGHGFVRGSHLARNPMVSPHGFVEDASAKLFDGPPVLDKSTALISRRAKFDTLHC